jgi:hypothetical protein
MQPFSSVLQFGTNPAALAEWFVASSALVIVVTLVYVFVLNRSPPPEGLTETKVEMEANSVEVSDPGPILSEANQTLAAGDIAKAVELAVKAARLTLSEVLRSSGIDTSNMNVSDMAYILQTRSAGSPDITQPLYQLNLLHLKVAQSQQITRQEAEWAINTSAWLAQLESQRSS